MTPKKTNGNICGKSSQIACDVLLDHEEKRCVCYLEVGHCIVLQYIAIRFCCDTCDTSFVASVGNS